MTNTLNFKTGSNQTHISSAKKTSFQKTEAVHRLENVPRMSSRLHFESGNSSISSHLEPIRDSFSDTPNQTFSESFQDQSDPDQLRFFSEASDISPDSRESKGFRDTDTDYISSTHQYETNSRDERPFSLDYDTNPHIERRFLDSNNNSLLPAVGSPAHSQYDYNIAHKPSSYRNTAHFLFTSNTNPSDTSLDTHAVPEKQSLSGASNQVNTNEKSRFRHIPDPNTISDYYHSNKKEYRHADMEHPNTYKNTKGFIHSQNTYPNSRTNTNKNTVRNPKLSFGNFSTSAPQQVHEPEKSTSSRLFEFALKNKKLAINKSLLNCLDQVADAIAEKVVTKQDGEITKPGLGHQHVDTLRVRPTGYNDTYLSNGCNEISGAYSPVNPTISEKVNTTSFSNQYKAGEPNERANPAKRADTDKSLCLKRRSKKIDRDADFKQSFQDLEDFVLRIPQGATILRYFYQRQKYDKNVDIQDLVKSMDMANLGLVGKGEFLNSERREKNGNGPKANRAASLPVCKSKFSVDEHVALDGLESPVYSSPSPSVFTEPMNIGTSFPTCTKSRPFESFHVSESGTNQSVSNTQDFSSYKDQLTINDSISEDYVNDTYNNDPQSNDVTFVRNTNENVDPNAEDAFPIFNNFVAQDRSYKTQDTPSTNDVSGLKARLQDLETQLYEMAKELESRDTTQSSLLSQNTLLLNSNTVLEAANKKLSQRVKFLEQEQTQTSLRIRAIKGTSKPLSKDRMPDARSNRIPESHKIYNRLEMAEIDKLGQIEAQNVLKNVCLQVGSRYSTLERRLGTLVKAAKHGTN